MLRDIKNDLKERYLHNLYKGTTNTENKSIYSLVYTNTLYFLLIFIVIRILRTQYMGYIIETFDTIDFASSFIKNNFHFLFLLLLLFARISPFLLNSFFHGIVQFFEIEDKIYKTKYFSIIKKCTLYFLIGILLVEFYFF